MAIAEPIEFAGKLGGRVGGIRLHHGWLARLQRVGYGPFHRRMVVAKRKCAVLGIRIQEATPVGVEQPHAFATHEVPIHASQAH